MYISTQHNSGDETNKTCSTWCLKCLKTGHLQGRKALVRCPIVKLVRQTPPSELDRRREFGDTARVTMESPHEWEHIVAGTEKNASAQSARELKEDCLHDFPQSTRFQAGQLLHSCVSLGLAKLGSDCLWHVDACFLMISASGGGTMVHAPVSLQTVRHGALDSSLACAWQLLCLHRRQRY